MDKTESKTKTSKGSKTPHACNFRAVSKVDAARMLAQIFKQQAGKIASVEYMKADGSTGKHNCRLGVKRYVKGTESPEVQAKRLQSGNLTVYKMADARNKGAGSQNYRTLKPESIISLKAGGLHWKFERE